MNYAQDYYFEALKQIEILKSEEENNEKFTK